MREDAGSHARRRDERGCGEELERRERASRRRRTHKNRLDRALSRPEKEHDRGSAASSEPRPAFGPFAVRRRHRPRAGREDTGRRRSAAEGSAGHDPITRPPLPLPASKTLSVSLQRTTYGPLRGREPVPGDWAHGPVRGRDPAPEGWANPGPCVSPLRGENKRGLATPVPKPVPKRVPEGAAFYVPFGPVTKGTPSAQAGGPVGRNETPGPSGSPPAERIRTHVIQERYFRRPT